MNSFRRKLLKVKTFLEIRRVVTPKKSKKEHPSETGIRLEKPKRGEAPVIDIKRDKPF
jgi:hypothetical protein